MRKAKQSGYFEPSLLATGGGFADLAGASIEAEAADSASDYDPEELNQVDDDFDRWLEVQSLRFRSRLDPE